MTRNELKNLANRLSEECGEAHRGAFWWQQDERIAVCFGNDGTDDGMDPRAVCALSAVRRLLSAYGGEELGFTECSQGGGWTMVCRLPESLNPSVLEGVLWYAWSEAEDHLTREKKGMVSDPLVLDWDTIEKNLKSRKFRSLTGAVIGIQSNIARAVLERAGLWEDDEQDDLAGRGS